MAKRALIVDDEKAARLLWAAVAKEWEIEVVEAEDGRAALNLLRGAGVFDLVVLDVMMPFMDGYEVVKHMREDERLKAIPVIISTANRTTQALAEVPFDDHTIFVNKASGLESIRRGIAKALGAKQ